MKKCLKIRVTGNVQGVGYRKFVQKQAENLEIEGTIQNSHDGSVIIYTCGFSDKLDDFLDILYQGPSKSEIKDLVVEPLPMEKDFRGVFRIIGLL